MGSSRSKVRAAPAYTYRNNEFLGDMAAWRRQNSDDNSERLERLRRNLRQVRERELTPRQQLVLRMYYDEGKSIAKIAKSLKVNKSTVSRTISRGRKRLHQYLQYCL